jgi:hypothetical protein
VRITVSRSGGVTGVTRRWVVDTEGPDSSDWLVLVDACPWEEHLDDPPQPDRYVYVILTDAHEARLPEQRIAGPWRELVDRVRSAGRPEPARRRDTEDRPDDNPGA